MALSSSRTSVISRSAPAFRAKSRSRMRCSLAACGNRFVSSTTSTTFGAPSLLRPADLLGRRVVDAPVEDCRKHALEGVLDDFQVVEVQLALGELAVLQDRESTRLNTS